MSDETEKSTLILGVSAGIAVYKAADLCSRLAKKYRVLVVMTPNAQKLISPRIFFTLSGNPVLTDLFNTPEWKPAHVAWAQQAGLLVVAPCTFNFIGKYTYGIADDPLTTTAAAFSGPVLLAPAMNPVMLANPAYLENLRVLASRGVRFVGPETGHLACGDSGPGRMSEPADIAAAVDAVFAENPAR